MTTETYSPDDFILGPDLVVTTVGHFQGGINVPRLTPIMLDATVGTFKVWDGSVGKAIGLTATAVLPWQWAAINYVSWNFSRQMLCVKVPIR
ncbi:hypothetical protein ACWY3K_14335 [Escherichia coli]